MLLITFLVTLELSVASLLGSFTPHFVFAGILALTLVSDRYHSIVWLIVGGLLLDLVSGVRIGFHLVSFSVLITFLYIIVQQFLHKPNLAIGFGFFFLWSLLFETLLSLSYGAYAWQSIFPSLATAVSAGMMYQGLITFSKSKELYRLA